MPNSVRIGFGPVMKTAHQDDSNDTPQPICEFQVRFLRACSHGSAKLMLTEFGIHYRLESCVAFLVFCLFRLSLANQSAQILVKSFTTYVMVQAGAPPMQ